MSFTKLFQSILDSTIWRETNETRLVWITMLAMADKFGDVQASIPGLADRARVTTEECEAALASLMAPDKYSRTKAHEGRRIEEIDGGWNLLNHAKYRKKMNEEERREYLRVKQAERRERIKAGQHPSTKVNKCSPPSTHAEAEAEAEAKSKGGPPLTPPYELPHAAAFADAWTDWLNYRKEKRNTVAPSTAKRQLKNLGRMSEEGAVAAIDQAIERGWTGLFPKFTPPTLPEAIEFRPADPLLVKSWHASRSAVGWKLSGSPIVNWQADLAGYEAKTERNGEHKKTFKPNRNTGTANDPSTRIPTPGVPRPPDDF